MDVRIDDLVSTVHATDGQSALPPEVMREVVRVAVAAVRAELAHDQRLRAERRLAAGDGPAPLGGAG
jgi:hypothetical protein